MRSVTIQQLRLACGKSLAAQLPPDQAALVARALGVANSHVVRPADLSLGITLPASGVVDERPLERSKFYLSLATENADELVGAQAFMRDVLARCRARGVSLMTKIEDHDYDSPCLYTWHPEELAKILRLTRDEYAERVRFVDVPRAFQAVVPGFAATHVGRVEEPIGGVRGNSHSARLGVIGAGLDTLLARGETLDREHWKALCAAAGVRAEAPWRVV